MLNYTGPERRKFEHKVQFMLAGSPPAPVVMQRFKEETNVEVVTAYGLTEVYGPVTAHKQQRVIHNHNTNGLNVAHNDDNNNNNNNNNNKHHYHQHLGEIEYTSDSVIQTPTIALDEITIRYPQSMEEVPPDGITIGEVMMRGNTVMKGEF